jgi:hypothetical protein
VNEALISIGPLFLANAFVRTAQEVYAKRQLDQIAVASRSTATVIRDGQQQTVDPAQLVRGDILRVRAGDQIVADGMVLGGGRLEIDESCSAKNPILFPNAAVIDSSRAAFALPATILTMLIGVALYAGFYTVVLKGMQTYQVPTEIIDRFQEFTGLVHNVDDKFGAAAATIVAQTVLSIFITVTGFLLILFLKPPFKFFTGWTEESADRRPALMALAP